MNEAGGKEEEKRDKMNARKRNLNANMKKKRRMVKKKGEGGREEDA